MKIRKITIKNYKIFDNLELDFTDSNGNTLDTVVLAGINGSGKTSILQLLQKIFSKESNAFIINEDIPLDDFKKDNDALICDELTIEFECSLDVIKGFTGLISEFKQEATKRKINIHNNLSKTLKNITTLLSNSRNKSGIKTFEFNYKVIERKGKILISKNDFVAFSILPEDDFEKYFSVLYFVASSFEIQKSYEENRFFEVVSENKKKSYNRDGIVRLVDIFSHKKEIEEYLVKSIIDAVLENRDIPVKNAIDIRIKEVRAILKGIKLNTKLVDLTSEKIIFESINGKKISIDELSSGEKQLYYRAAFLSKLNIRNSLILVDEPENSLHPNWQRDIIKLYQNVGENNQVILATHSPYIISSIHPKNIFILYFDEQTNTVKVMNMEKEQRYTKGVEPNRILQEIMGYTLRDEETQSKIDDITILLRQENINIKEIEEKLDVLSRDLGQHDPSIIGFKNHLFLIKRKINSK